MRIILLGAPGAGKEAHKIHDELHRSGEETDQDV